MRCSWSIGTSSDRSEKFDECIRWSMCLWTKKKRTRSIDLLVVSTVRRFFGTIRGNDDRSKWRVSTRSAVLRRRKPIYRIESLFDERQREPRAGKQHIICTWEFGSKDVVAMELDGRTTLAGSIFGSCARRKSWNLIGRSNGNHSSE